MTTIDIVDKVIEKKYYLIYARKSEEAEDKQVNSIPDQLKAIEPLYKNNNLLILDQPFTEARSAKTPDRPEFNRMLDLINGRNDIKGIVCWKLNRLSRNPIDEGKLRWLLQNGQIEEIITPEKTYTQIDSDFIMAIEGAQSQRFISDLKKDSARGVQSKLDKGNAPILAPVGYYNDVLKDQGKRDILPDPDKERFDLVRKMWDLLLSGQYNQLQILRIATDKWGLRRRNGKPISKTQIYKLFTNIFYTGKYYVYAGVTYDNGIHKPMITIEEYDLAQKILGIKGNPRFKTRVFAYTNWLKCVCGSGITADERLRRWCSNCKTKRNAEKHESCPKCKQPLSKKLQFTVQYHCTKKLNPKCKQKSISLANLELQIDNLLSSFTLPQPYIDWTLQELRRIDKEESTDRQTVEGSLSNTVLNVSKKIDNLHYKFLSEENKNGELFTDLEYKEMKFSLIKEKEDLEKQLREQNNRQLNWIDTAEKAFNFTRHARYWLANGTKQQRRSIFQCLTSSNPILEDGLVRVRLLNAFEAIKNMAIFVNENKDQFEPQNQPQKGVFLSKEFGLGWSSELNSNHQLDYIRTAFLNTDFVFPIPDYSNVII